MFVRFLDLIENLMGRWVIVLLMGISGGDQVVRKGDSQLDSRNSKEISLFKPQKGLDKWGHFT